MHPQRKGERVLRPVESLLFEKVPTVLATQERFTIFQQELQKHVKEGAIFASVPCGLMSDLLTLDFSRISDFQLFGVDIDSKAISKLQQRVSGDVLQAHCTLYAADAWTFELPQSVDVLTSNGLNIYEQDDERVVQLYKQFAHNLKPGGTLITSFLTPPTDWKMDEVNSEYARVQRIIFVDVLQVAWQAFRSVELTRQQLHAAGFVEIEVIMDRAGIFPTIIAKKEASE